MPFTIQDITKNVNKRTEGRAGTKLDLITEFSFALDEFVGDGHFWWSNKRLILPLLVGDIKKDLSGVAPDFAQFDELYLMSPDGLTVQAEMSPLLDSRAQMTAVMNTVQGLPAVYFIDTNETLQMLRLGAPSSVAQNLMGKYWAQPMLTDPAVDIIPLVPPFLHWGLIHALERRVFKFLYGVGDVRATTAEADYQNFIKIAARKPSWTDRQMQSVSLGSGSAVQAH